MDDFDARFDLKLTDKEVVNLFKEADTDASGTIDFRCVSRYRWICFRNLVNYMFGYFDPLYIIIDYTNK